MVAIVMSPEQRHYKGTSKRPKGLQFPWVSRKILTWPLLGDQEKRSGTKGKVLLRDRKTQASSEKPELTEEGSSWLALGMWLPWVTARWGGGRQHVSDTYG